MRVLYRKPPDSQYREFSPLARRRPLVTVVNHGEEQVRVDVTGVDVVTGGTFTAPRFSGRLERAQSAPN